MSKMKLLDKITCLKSLRELPENKLPQLAEEIRQEMIEIVSVTGGHLGAGLGVIELTIAIHKIFDTPKDKLIWDVGHQSYPHKILTGRREVMHTIRQKDGLSGFTNRAESIFDPFGAAHSSTSISAALGMQVAASIHNLKNRVIAVIGDGAMSAGMAFEALNNAGADKSIDNQIIVILNDNDMSIAPPVGAMSKYLARLFSGKGYVNFKNIAKQVVSKLPAEIGAKAEKVQEYGKTILTGGTLFEELGFNYIGPVDGHNFQHLIPVLKNIKNNPQGPTLIHAITKKGKGYLPAEKAQDKLHGVSKFEIDTGKQKNTDKKLPTYTKIFSETLVEFAKQDSDIVGITSAMPGGTGMDKFAKIFPQRCFDVGIAEQHALTFAAGMASQKIKPFVAIYSTFLQRAYDQVVHDIAIQKLPVRIAIDRAGLVGEDGPTHAGAFDITFLATLPNFILMAPSDENELVRMIATAVDINHAPCAFRYPRGQITGNVSIQKPARKIEIGKGRIVRKGQDIAIINYGTRMKECLIAAEKLEKDNIFLTIVDARFAKPLDTELLTQIIEKHAQVITIEEGAIGGFATQILNYLAKSDKRKFLSKISPMFLPDKFIYQAKVEQMYREALLDSEAIINKVYKLAKVKQ